MNKIALTGRLTADPKLKTTQDGTNVCSFSLAVKRPFARDTVDFINCVAWKADADFIAQYGSKGRMTAVSGYIQTRSYNDKYGNKRTVTEVVCDSVELLDKQQTTPTIDDDDDDVGFNDMPQRRHRSGSTEDNTSFTPAQPQFEELKTDDDLPF